MDKLTSFINSSQSISSLVTHKIHELDLKINQQLMVKVISTKNNSQSLILQASQASKPIHVKIDFPVELIQAFKQGQSLQLLVTQLMPALEFEILKNNTESKHPLINQSNEPTNLKKLVLKQFFPTSEGQKQPLDSKSLTPTIPQIISARIIAIDTGTVQLKISGQEVITLSKDQITQPVSKHQTFKIGQTIQLEVSDKSTINPSFKRIEKSTSTLAVGQQFSAKVIEVKNNTIQLQLQPATQLENNKIDSQVSTLTLNKSQLLPLTTLPSNTSSPLLKQGQTIQFEVIKTGATPEFKIINNNTSVNSINQQILDTIKHVLPIQQPPSEQIGHLINNLSIINKNETISDNLKWLAKEIINTLPQLNDTKNPKQLKKAISQSGLFLEPKLSQFTNEKGFNFPADFKNKLLKFQHALKQELELKTGSKSSSNELSLMKEMQQKTENSLARIILNQLASLPKEEGVRQSWLLDLPFLNKGAAESVKIEIERDQQSDSHEKEDNWAVTLTITPPDLATIHCKISCIDKTVNTRFWSDCQGVVTKITRHLDYLEKQFKAVGLESGHLSAYKGKETKDSFPQVSQQNLLDQNA